LASGAAQTFPAPAIAQGIRQLKMVTDWPDGTPGLHTSAVRLAKAIGVATGGRIQVEVFPAGALVRAFETFDAVAAGVADIYHSFEGYFEQKARALTFFSAIPFEIGSGDVWDSLDASDRQVIDAVAACEYARSLAEFDANNAVSLRKLRDEGTVKIRKFEDTPLRALIKESRDVVADAGARDDLSKKIYLSYEQFRASIMDWSDISERAYLNSRALA
jgi:TRAP-type mannitol/chloroaromatic compound transport system substrate-binding protein